ncbi:MAG TPA: hypothetical protein VN888_00675 [Mycobacterium sp.]|nr:hypothetical protein [Mycobacterium sp.]
MNDAARVSSTWDVHIAYLPPHRWDELAHHDDDALRRITGRPCRPGLVAEPIAWDALHITPRWLGDDSSRAVAALQPGLFANRGADEWRRFHAGAQNRGELALAISMIGSPEQPKTVSFMGPGPASHSQAAWMRPNTLAAHGLHSPRRHRPQKA